jgi:hypothetical protein
MLGSSALAIFASDAMDMIFFDGFFCRLRMGDQNLTVLPPDFKTTLKFQAYICEAF